jgi:hypothetical protein
MPVGVTLKRAATVALVVAATIAVSGCASADHSWRGEFVARLEGASAAMEETLAETRPDMSEIELAETVYPLGRELLFKSELIEKLDPPADCATVQEEGAKRVLSSGLFAAQLLKNLTPYLKRHFPGDVREMIAGLKAVKAKSETCATG